MTDWDTLVATLKNTPAKTFKAYQRWSGWRVGEGHPIHMDIFEHDVIEILLSTPPDIEVIGYITDYGPDGDPSTDYVDGEGTEWFRTREDAIANAKGKK